MRTTNNTIFISGGSAGIGFEIAKIFLQAGNKVIINGRNDQRLSIALQSLPGADGIAGDISVTHERVRIAEQLKNDFPGINIIINNAGTVNFHGFDQPGRSFEFAQQEINTNYLAVVHFTELMLPLLMANEFPAIVNVTSQAAFKPFSPAPTYAASKTALHFYTQSLRAALAGKSTRIFELIPPLVNTEFSSTIGGETNGIPPSEVAKELIQAFENDQLDVPVGNAKSIYAAIQNARGTRA